MIIGITLDQYGLIKAGDRVRLLHPSGVSVAANVTGVEYPPSVIWSGPRPVNPKCGVIVDQDAKVPKGTKVFVETN